MGLVVFTEHTGGYEVTPIAPPSDVFEGNGGPQTPHFGVILWDSQTGGYTINPVLTPSDILEGNGGPTSSGFSAILWNSQTGGYNLNLAASITTFTWSIPSPILFPKRVHFDATDSAGYVEPDYFWDFGDGNEAIGAIYDHEYAEFGVYTVTLLIVSNGGIFISEENTQQVIVADERSLPVEAISDVLNLTLGRHGYEPLRTLAATVPANEVRQYATTLLAGAATGDIITHQVLRFSTINHIIVSAPTDSTYRVYVDDAQVIPTRRLYRHHRDIDLLAGAVIALGERQTIRVEVTNDSINEVLFEASIHGGAV